MAVAAATRTIVTSDVVESDRPSWSTLERQYQQGIAALNVVAVPVVQPADLPEPIGLSRERSASKSSSEMSAGAEYAREVYEEKGYLPALPNRESRSPRLCRCRQS